MTVADGRWPTEHGGGPGPAAVAVGRVVHHRHHPEVHRFAYPMTQIWIDPDDPGELFRHHRLWSHRRPAPVRFRRRDYLDGDGRHLGPAVRRRLAEHLGRPVDGPLRMLTQPRVWGWLFNPLTIYLAWEREGSGQSDHRTGAGPQAALLEVTNTPWKERHTYALPLEPTGGAVEARFPKRLHVSPFLDLDLAYHLRLVWRSDHMLDLSLDTVPEPVAVDRAGAAPIDADGQDRPPSPVVSTRLVTRLEPAGTRSARRAMTAAVRPDRLPTHRVSLGIHRQALALWRKRVPFVPHPGGAR